MREEMFRRTDQDRGGTITKEELTNVMSERGPSSAGVNIDQLFSQIDARMRMARSTERGTTSS